MGKKITAIELVKMVGGDLSGDKDIELFGFAPVDTATNKEITFWDGKGDNSLVELSQAGLILVSKECKVQGSSLVKVDDIYLAAAKVHNFFLEEDFVSKGIHESVVIGDGCNVDSKISVASHVSIGNNVQICEKVSIDPGVVIGNNVHIGVGCNIKSNVVICDGSIIGNSVIIHSGTVVGSDGYGYATDKEGFHYKRPQVGIVRIGDMVEIGANCAIDCATFGETIIKSGAKIDNLVHIAHNVVVGENTLLTAQVGIAGSTTLGRNVVLGGQTGVKDHIEIGDGVMAAARTGISHSQEKGAVVSGMPAIPLKKWLKSSIIFSKLPYMFKELKKLRSEINKIKKEVGDE